MFHIGLMEWVFISAIALLLIGPEQLPKVAQVIGQSFNELKRVMDSMKTDTTQNIRDVSETPKQIQQPVEDMHPSKEKPKDLQE